MIILKIAAFWLPMVGIGGIVGAAETGTSPVNAVAALILGCIAMAAYIKTESAPCWKGKAYREEKAMGGFEKEELQARAKGMQPEEQAIVAMALRDSILFGELYRRYMDLCEKVENVSRAVGGEGGDSNGV